MTSLLSSRPMRTALVLALAVSSAAAQSLLSQHGEVLLGCNEPAPGIAGATVNGSAFAFGTPVLDANGAAAFRVQLTTGVGGVASTDNYAIYVGQGAGDLQLAVRADDPAPGLPGVTLRGSSASTGPNANVNISPFGEILFTSTSLQGTGISTANDSALLWGQAGGMLLLVQEGEQAPHLPAGTFWGPVVSMSRTTHTINKDGRVVFPITMTGAVTAADDLFLVTGFPGSFETVLREGDDLDGLGGTVAVQFGTTLSYTSQINDAGQILIDGKLAGTAVATNDTYLGVFNPGSGVSIFVREGDQAPGLAAGVTLTGSAGHGANVWNNSGNTVFSYGLDDGGVTIDTTNDTALFYGGMGGVSLVAQKGDAIGLPGGERWAGNWNATSLTCNESGQIAFLSSLLDASGTPLPATSDTAMFVGTPGNWTEVMREGDVVAALPPTVNGPWTFTAITGSISMNAQGQLMIAQSATDSVSTVTYFFLYDAVHGLQVARDQTESYTTTIGTGVATSSTSYGGPQSNGDGCSAWFNNNGDFVFRQSIDNGVLAAVVRGHSGMLVAKPASISVVTGGTQTFAIDAGPAKAFNFYVVIGTQSGTRPGFVLPQFGALNIPLNFDGWTQLSLDLANSSVYTNSIFLTDANGQATAAFNLPGGLAPGSMLLHHAAVGLDFSLMETFVTEPGALKLY